MNIKRMLAKWLAPEINRQLAYFWPVLPGDWVYHKGLNEEFKVISVAQRTATVKATGCKQRKVAISALRTIKRSPKLKTEEAA
ncbi:hypothetical protein LJ739_06870 [Aestuariibacter halophilus]|uniref:Uncharacterized protein n=1 Tax=Fluctibacter halophilus TaxID=226011 RepID=A0ABS8G5T3_9ALTE|nr:hypothetical protein [Aestuariibacter halophilus]MCC2615959.1 hypothetical protein [Aestuariibacter halophilus]